MPAAGIEIKTSTMHVEAAIRVISGRGFNSLRLHLIPATGIEPGQKLGQKLLAFVRVFASSLWHEPNKDRA